MSAGFSILQFAFVNFYNVLMSNRLSEPTFTDLCRLTETMILGEPEVDEDLLAEVRYIYDHTDSEIDISLAQLELLVFWQLRSSSGGLNKELDINGKSYKIIDLYGHLDKVNKKLTKIVVGISKKYNLEIPMSGMMGGGGGSGGGKLIM